MTASSLCARHWAYLLSHLLSSQIFVEWMKNDPILHFCFLTCHWLLNELDFGITFKNYQSLQPPSCQTEWTRFGLYPHSIGPCQMPLNSGISLGVPLCRALLYTTLEFWGYTFARYMSLAPFLVDVPSSSILMTSWFSHLSVSSLDLSSVFKIHIPVSAWSVCLYIHSVGIPN